MSMSCRQRATPARSSRRSVDMAQGSFTGRACQETAYVISVSECNASHAQNFGTKRVAIFAGQRLVADMDVNFKSGIVRKTDLEW